MSSMVIATIHASRRDPDVDPSTDNLAHILKVDIIVTWHKTLPGARAGSSGYTVEALTHRLVDGQQFVRDPNRSLRQELDRFDQKPDALRFACNTSLRFDKEANEVVQRFTLSTKAKKTTGSTTP